MRLPYAAYSHFLPLLMTVCQFLMRFVSVLQSLYCLACVVGQRSFIQLRIMAYLLALTLFIGHYVLFFK